MATKELITQNNCFVSVLACIFLTIAYVASLYIWRSPLSRDHPSTIKRRFFSVTCMMIFAPFFTFYFLTEETIIKGSLYALFGLRLSGIVQAIVVPLILTATLFLGPLSMQFLSGAWKLYAEPLYWVSSWQDLEWVRNHVMAPLSEEWVFRACMVPLLLQCFEPMTTVFASPLLFGIAHFHHMCEQLKAGFKLKTALMLSTFQFTYTSLFGAYSAFIFVRTGHFVAPLLAHMFCNHMGFPNFGEIKNYPPLQRIIIIFNVFLGFVLWCMLLYPLTNPNIYSNRLYRDT